MDDAELLNHDQLRVVRVRLAHVEQAVQTIEDLLNGPMRSVYRTTSLDLDADQRRELERGLARMRAVLAAAAQRFALAPEQRDGARIARSALSVAWEGIEDAKAATLGRYGAVAPGAADVLDPFLDELIAQIFEALAVLDR